MEGADLAENGQEFTKARQLLAIHYLLTGTLYTTLQNSEIYKKYHQVPNFKKGQGLVADLLYIRSYFAALGLDAAVKVIDAEITREQREK